MKTKKRETKPIYNFSPEEILEKFNSARNGLSEKEAKKRLKEYGANKIKKKISFRWFFILISQLNSPLVLILLVAAFLSFMFNAPRDGSIILLIVLLNAAIGFMQEYKAERILSKIRRLTKDMAIVIRNGEKKEINSKSIVPGDIIFVSAGDNIPADGYIIEGYDFHVNAAVFTGESKPSEKKIGAIKKKNITLSEMQNMVFMGSEAARGEALILATATGMDTELGKIAYMSQEIITDETPLQKRMKTLGKQVAILASLIAIVVVIVSKLFIYISWYDTFLFALALSVSVVPEGLPAALSIALSLGMKKLLNVNVLAKRLTAVETLGSVSAICTDKTGTITENELTVTKIYLAGKLLEVTGIGYTPKGDFTLNQEKIIFGRGGEEERNLFKILKIGMLCNDASLIKEEGKYKIIGDPTEGALVVAAMKYNNEQGFYVRREKKITENPFSSQRMMMSVVYKGNSTLSYAKGSPDILLRLCDTIEIGGKIEKFTSKRKEEIRKIYNSMSKDSLRVLAFAYRDLKEFPKEKLNVEAERKLTWVGMMGMIDPPRPGIEEAIELCKKAHIKVIMITGDYEITAKAIASKAGLIDEKKKNSFRLINGKTLNSLSDEDIFSSIAVCDLIFARISPEQKLRIISLLKEAGMVIAMTGDGVNDALALKKADIGIAMGGMGTDVAKEASDMVLLDDNLASIVRAVKEGRIIYQNIKKFVHYIFSSNASELLTVIIGVIIGLPAPITAVQILIVDLGTDVFPSLALGVDPEEPGVMKKRPADIKEKLITKKGFKRLLYLASIMASCAILTFIWSLERGGWNFGDSLGSNTYLYIKSTTATYAVLAMTQMANLLESRSENLSVFKVGFFKNKFAILSIMISVLMLIAFMHVPFLRNLFHLAPIDKFDWIAVVVSTILVFILEEGRKLVKKA